MVRNDPRPDRRRVTHCPQGHEYTPDNSYIHPRTGARKCRACQHEWSRRAFRRKLYGLTVEQYEHLLAQQGGRCAICGSTENDGVALGVDHDHATGVVRGLLCDKCNQAIGALREDPVLFAAAVAYLRAAPPVIPALASEIKALTWTCALCGATGVGARIRKQVDGRTVTLCPSCAGHA